MSTWTISRRLTLGFAVVVTIVLGLAATFLVSLRRVDVRTTSIAKDSLPGLALSNNALQHTLNLRVLMLRQLLASDHAELKDLDRQSTALFDRTNSTILAYEKTITDAEDRRNFTAAVAAFEKYRGVNEEIRALSLQGKDVQARTVVNQRGVPTYQAFEDAMRAVAAWNENAARTAASGIMDIMVSTRVLTVVIAAIAVLAAVVAGFAITRTIGHVVQRVADSLNEGSEQVTAAAAQVSSSGQLLAEGATEQAASIEETSASLEELSSMTKRNADSAQQAKDLAAQTRNAADGGAGDVEDMKRAMDAIKTSSAGISKIIKTIDEIAFQTNILALNAAVEAARAGDAGMGFAVVAEEVRSLAQRSAQSARETATKIEEAIQNGERGVVISEKVAGSLSDIVVKARQVDELVAEIASASQQQSLGIAQLNTAVSQMDKVTQTNASSAEESAAAAEELSAQAVAMRGNVGELMRLVGNAGSVPASHPVTTPRHAKAPQDRAADSRPQPKLSPPRRNGHAPHGALELNGGVQGSRPAIIAAANDNDAHWRG